MHADLLILFGIFMSLIVNLMIYKWSKSGKVNGTRRLLSLSISLGCLLANLYFIYLFYWLGRQFTAESYVMVYSPLILNGVLSILLVRRMVNSSREMEIM